MIACGAFRKGESCCDMVLYKQRWELPLLRRENRGLDRDAGVLLPDSV